MPTGGSKCTKERKVFNGFGWGGRQIGKRDLKREKSEKVLRGRGGGGGDRKGAPPPGGGA